MTNKGLKKRWIFSSETGMELWIYFNEYTWDRKTGRKSRQKDKNNYPWSSNRELTNNQNNCHKFKFKGSDKVWNL